MSNRTALTQPDLDSTSLQNCTRATNASSSKSYFLDFEAGVALKLATGSHLGCHFNENKDYAMQ